MRLSCICKHNKKGKKMSVFTSPKFLAFIGGIAAAGAGAAMAKAPGVRKVAVNALAQGMKAQDCLKENFQSIKESAEDLANDAREQAKLQAEQADRRAAIEARIREEVEAEFEKEEQVLAAKAAKEEAAASKKTATKKTSTKKTAAKN